MTPSMHITLPEQLRKFVEEQAAKAGYPNSSDYVREVLAEEQARRERDAVDAKLLHALEGPFHPMTVENFRDLRAAAHKRVSTQSH